MISTDRLWYGAVTVVAWAYYSKEAGSDGPPVLRRPSWAPVQLLLLVRKWHAFNCRCLLVLGLCLAVHERVVELQCLRTAFFLAVACADFVAFAAYGGHTGFVLVYTSLAMVLPPGPARSGVLRLVVAHQLGSSGVQKLRIGGLRWLRPSTMRFLLQFLHDQAAPFKPHFLVEPPWLKQRWIIALCLQRTGALAFLTVSGVIMELGVLAACFVGGRISLLLACMAGCGFHLLAAPLMGIVFPFSIQCYMVALLPTAAWEPACLISFPALVTAIILGASGWLALEDWPLNAMALFPWNADQAAALSAQRGRFMLAHSTSSGKSEGSPICLTELCCSTCPANYYPGHIEALGGEEFYTHEEEELLTRRRLAEWVRQSQRFVDDRRPEAGGQPGRCFDDVALARAGGPLLTGKVIGKAAGKQE